MDWLMKMKSLIPTTEHTVKINTIPNDKERVRARRNFVARHNVHKGGYHTSAKYCRRTKHKKVLDNMVLAMI